MAQLPDNVTLADKVMFLIRTKYSEWRSKDLPFDAAFMELMDKYAVDGDKRHPIKVAIGHILADRKKSLAEKNGQLTRPKGPDFTFVVERKSRNEIVLQCTMMGDKITYRRDASGNTVHTAHTGNPPRIAILRGVEKADQIFTEMDSEAILASEIRIIDKDDTQMHAVLGGMYDAQLARGKNGSVVAIVMLEGVEILQKEVPGNLVDEVRSIAKQHFKDTRTADLFPE